MTTTTRTPTTSRSADGLVVTLRVGDRYTDVDVLASDGVETVRLAMVPDADAAKRLAATVRRICWVALTVFDDGHVTADLSAIGHRVPICRGISVGTALALAGRQVPTVVRRRTGPPR